MVLVIKEPKPLRVSKPKSINLVPAEDSAASNIQATDKKMTMLTNLLSIRYSENKDTGMKYEYES